MALLRLLLFSAFLGLPGLAFPPGDGASSHSLRYFYTIVSEPDIGVFQFVVVGYVNDQPIQQYNSKEKRFLPKAPWVEEAARDVNQFWDRYTKVMKDKEAIYTVFLGIIRDNYNRTGGFHTLQEMSSCELRKDGSKRGHYQNAYDGRDFISLDKETLTWTAADTAAQIIKRKVEAEPSVAQCFKAYLEEECIDWLKKYLDYGKEVLLRTETPLGKVTRQAIGGGQEALICQAYGFYPKEIDTTWRKGEEILEHETFRRNIAPNSDGTYHVWLSIKIDPKERDLYQCHVDHASLPTPLVLAFKEPGVNVGFITGIILGVLIVLLVAAGSCFLIIRNRQARAPSSNGPISTQWPSGM